MVEVECPCESFDCILQLVDVSYLNLVFVLELLDGQEVHPDFIQGVHLWHKKNNFVVVQVDQCEAVHLLDTGQVVEVCVLVLWVADVRAV